MRTEPVETMRQTHSRITLFGASGAPARLARRGVACALLALTPGMAMAQYDGAPAPPPDYGNAPPSNYQPLAPEQIDSLVAPIALYPDSLVAQVLAGATYPAQLASAEQFVQQNGGYPPSQLAEMANTQPWDPSVKSLVAFPQVLEDLNRNMQWTTQLGNAYFNQPQDVLGAVQTMRQRAYAAGNLRPTQQINVTYAPGDILIAPVTPTLVYVPYYNPWVVYGAPVPVYPHYYYGPPRGVVFGTGLAIGFGLGIAIGAFTHFSWGYHNWAPNWHDRTVVYNHNTYISRSVTVVNHGDYGRFDRAPEARAFNQTQAVRYGGNNRTTINNVTINRGGNTINRGGNTFNRGANTYNNGGNTINRGANTYNNGGNTVNRGANTYNNGGNTYNHGTNTYNRGENTYNAGRQPSAGGAYDRGQYANGANRPAAPANPQPFGQRGYGGQPTAPARPQGNYSGQGSYNRPQENRGAQPQQHSAPQEQRGGGGGHESHGGGDHGGGGGHDGHH